MRCYDMHGERSPRTPCTKEKRLKVAGLLENRSQRNTFLHSQLQEAFWKMYELQGNSAVEEVAA
jgi:hypothetical protein